jgi:hypothetical protein
MKSRRRSYLRPNKFDGQFAGRLIAMLQSPAWRVLSLAARRLLDRIEIELAKHGGEDNGKLVVTYEHFIEYGIHKDSIAPAIRECEALGFVDAEHGQAGNREYRWPSSYRLTYLRVGRAKPTHEWKRFATIDEAEAIARVARGPARQRKQKTTPGIRPSFAPGNHGRKAKFSPPDSMGKVSPPDSMGTSRLSGASLRQRRNRPRQVCVGAPKADTHTHTQVVCGDGEGSGEKKQAEKQTNEMPPDDGRHTRESLMTYVANVIDEELHDLDRHRVAARKRAELVREMEDVTGKRRT